MAALIARRRDSNFAGRELVSETEETGAKAFLPQKIDRHETADEKKRDGHCYRGKRLPKIGSHQMIGEFGNKRFVRRREESINRGPDKHVQRANEWRIHQQSRPERLWMKPHLFQQPAAEILQSENVTAPAANVSPENQRRQDRQSKKDKPSINESLLQGVHGLGGLNRGNCFARHPPLDEMSDHKQIEKDKRERAPAGCLRFSNAKWPIRRMLASSGLNYSLSL